MTAQQDYFLSKGSHTTAADGRCAMEWVSYLAGESHSDRPVCVSPVLQNFCIALNDRLPDDERQKLRPYLARTIGTAGDGRDEERVQILREWLVRERLPRSLELAGRHGVAEQLRELPGELTGGAVSAACLRARDEARAARLEARDRLYRVCRKPYAAVAAYGAAYTAAIAGVAVDVAAYAAVAYVAAYVAAYAAAAAKSDVAEIRERARVAAEEKLRLLIEQSRLDAFGLLERMLPKEVIRLPVVEDADAVCGVRVA